MYCYMIKERVIVISSHKKTPLISYSELYKIFSTYTAREFNTLFNIILWEYSLIYW